MKLYLDDIRPCPSGYLLARNIDEFKSICSTKNITHISFDHDLGETETGLDAVKWLIKVEYPHLQTWEVHSANPVGKENINSLLNSWFKWR